jgi:hypothetical protein
MSTGFWFSVLAFIANLALFIILVVRYYDQHSDGARRPGDIDGPVA